MTRITRCTTPILILALAGGCSEAPESELASVEAVADHPSRFEGKLVTLAGEVDDIYGSSAFELQSEEDPFEIWEESVLVVTDAPILMAGEGLEDDDEVLVTGTVRTLTAMDVSQRPGWDLPKDLVVRTAKMPVLQADTVTVIERRALWRNRDAMLGGSAGAVTENGADPEAELVLPAADETAANATGRRAAANSGGVGNGVMSYREYASQDTPTPSATVRGEAVVTKVISDRAFWLETEGVNGNEPVLAIVREDVPRHEMIDIDAGQTLRFQSEIVQADGDAASEISGTLEADAQQAIEEEDSFLSMHWSDVRILASR